MTRLLSVTARGHSNHFLFDRSQYSTFSLKLIPSSHESILGEDFLSVTQLVQEIDNGDIVLPAIQRNFVWGEDQIEILLDSLFRGYPVGKRWLGLSEQFRAFC